MRATDELLLGLPESTYAVEPVPAPAAANVLWLRDVEDTPLEVEEDEEINLNPEFGARPVNVFSPRHGLNFTVPLVGHDTPGTALLDGFLLRSCGMSQDVTALTSAVYQPASLSTDSCALWRYKGGNVYKMRGSRGTWTLSMSLKKVLERKYSMKGLYSPVAAAAVPKGDFTAWPKPIPLAPASGAAFSIHGFAGAIEAMEIEMGNEYDYEGRIGNESIEINGRVMKGQITIEAVSESEHPFISICESGALGPIALTIVGPGAGTQRKLDISMPLVQLMNPKYVAIGNNRQGLQMDLRITPTAAGDDEYVETWSEVV